MTGTQQAEAANVQEPSLKRAVSYLELVQRLRVEERNLLSRQGRSTVASAGHALEMIQLQQIAGLLVKEHTTALKCWIERDSCGPGVTCDDGAIWQCTRDHDQWKHHNRVAMDAALTRHQR